MWCVVPAVINASYCSLVEEPECFLMTRHCNLSQANIMIHPGKINYCLEKCQSFLICNSNMSLLEPTVNCLGYEVFSKLLYNFITHSVFFPLPHPAHASICLIQMKNCFKQLPEKLFAMTTWGKKPTLAAIVNNIQDCKLELQQVLGGTCHHSLEM